jgi:hypothetical protein
LNKTITVANAPPVVSKFVADSPDVLRGRTVNLTVLGSDFETPSDKLVLKLEYVIGGSTDWESLPSTQTKVTYDAKLKLWNVVYTPTKDNYLGIYHIRASLKDLDNTNGPSGDLQDNLLVKNNPPKVKFTTKISVTTGEVVTFDGRDTTDVEDLVTYLKFEWDFKGDGVYEWSSLTTGNTSFTYDKPAFYMALFKVTDTNGTSVVTSVSIAIRPNEIGAKPVKNENGVGMSTLLLIIVIAVIVAVVIAAVVGYAMSKKVATVHKDEAAEQEVAEIKKLVEESKTTGANVDEAEALINQFEGR